MKNYGDVDGIHAHPRWTNPNNVTTFTAFKSFVVMFKHSILCGSENGRLLGAGAVNGRHCDVQ